MHGMPRFRMLQGMLRPGISCLFGALFPYPAGAARHGPGVGLKPMKAREECSFRQAINPGWANQWQLVKPSYANCDSVMMIS